MALERDCGEQSDIMEVTAKMQELTLSDDQIKEQLTSYNIFNIPINPSTRPVLLRKLSQLRLTDPIAKKESSKPPKENPPPPVMPHSQNFTTAPPSSAGQKDSQENQNQFPSLKTPELSEFRILIEEGDVITFEETVWENPRYLITNGDTPEILKVSTRYNALHCAIIKGNLKICKKIFEILEGDRFWTLMYPNDASTIRQRRRCHLVDLYLNTSDKGMHQTPLHFACKLGHLDIVVYLLHFPALDVRAVDRYDQMPCDITCSDQTASHAVKQRILDLIADPAYYVQVLRSADNTLHPRLATPCTLKDLDTRQSPLPEDRMNSPMVTSGIAGPMSPLQARMYYKEWRSPSSGIERKEAQNIKRSDPDRGMERVGRHLAHAWKIPWRERWDFLGGECDFSTSEGLHTLERHLEMISSSDQCLTRPSSSTTFLTGSEPTKLDFDVVLALDGCKVTEDTHPNIVHWKTLVSSYSEEEKKRWRTPSKQLYSKDRHTPQAQRSLHPLFSSSPTHPPVKLSLKFNQNSM